ncbi:MAG: hypothetical protein JW819_07580 [Candidatus Krumholzibacteriota bacterium]|nr:hypothetical protein [Candidatus Krumholzibacteriota bacterium]
MATTRRKADGSPVRALGLFSGGLDSMLAAWLLARQGVEVVALYAATGFGAAEQQRALAALDAGEPFPPPPSAPAAVRRAASELGLPLRVLDLGEAVLDLVLDPPHGWGANLNPCLDCHGAMLRAAAARLPVEGADFVFTGEVLGQRPMSQHGRGLALVAEIAGLSGRLLRPLSARRLPPTDAEIRGWVDREGLLDIQGRSRQEQLRLAREAGLEDFAAPAGGCLLTEPVYASRLWDWIRHAPAGRRPGAAERLLLRLGRHFRVDPAHKLVVGRREDENRLLARLRPAALRLEARDHAGPLALVERADGAAAWPADAALAAMAAAVARYGKGRAEARVVVIAQLADATRELDVAPLAGDAALASWRIPERFDPYRSAGR